MIFIKKYVGRKDLLNFNAIIANNIHFLQKLFNKKKFFRYIFLFNECKFTE